MNSSSKILKILPLLLVGIVLFLPNFGFAQTSCYDECSYVGAYSCSGTSARICGTGYDADYCLEWSPLQSCDTRCFVCGDGVCNSDCGEKYANCSADCVAPSLYVDLSAIPNSGTAPLNGVDLKAVLSGTAVSSTVWYFDCTNDGVFDFTNTIYPDSSNSYTAVDVCNYLTAGNYTARVRVFRAGVYAENTTPITVSSSCYDECSYSGQKQCSGTGAYQTCGNYDTDSCFEWSGAVSCSTGYTCSAGNCVYTAPTCNDECSYSGQKQCSGTGAYQTCGNYDTDSCFEWSGAVSCSTGYTCSAGNCVYTAPANNAPVANAGPDKTIYENESVIIYGSGSDADGDSLTYNWSCNGGTLSNYNVATPLYYAPCVSEDTTYSCTLMVTDSHGASNSDSVNILALRHHSPTLSATLIANPNVGCMPLTLVDLAATAYGTASGSATYYFDCTNDGNWEKVYTTAANSYTAYDLCSYTSSGSYTAKVKIERDNLSAENVAQVNVNSCYSVPIVDIKANSSDGPITINYNNSATISWTASNADSCQASGAWSGTKSTTGSESTGNLVSSKTYTITCTGQGGTVSDSVTVNVTSQSYNNPPVVDAGSDKTVYENGSVNLYGTAYSPDSYALTYSWSCNGGSLSNYNILAPLFYAPTVYSNTSYVCTLTATDSRGMTASDQVNIFVQNYQENLAISVSLSANPSSGCYPLNDVDLTASIYGTVSAGYTTYYFDCTNDGIWDKTVSEYSSYYTAYDLCDYPSSGNYSARVRVDRQGYTAENTVSISTNSCQGSITVNKLARNLSDGTGFSDYVSAKPGDVLSFSIRVQAGNSTLQDIILKDVLSNKFAIRSNTIKIDGTYSGGDIVSGLNIGYFSANQSKTITFDADVASSGNFSYGSNQIINSAMAYNSSVSNSDTATINVVRTSVLAAATGTATGVSTGLTNNIWVDSIVLPMGLALVLIFIFKSKIFKFEEWFDTRRKQYREYKSDKVLKIKITKTRIGEILGKKLS
jgi:hypothetical protein